MISPESLRGLYRASTVASAPDDVAGVALAVVTCMDHRLRPEPTLGVPAASVCMVRNAGGRVTDDALRSLVVASSTLDVNEIIVMQHTECALANVTNEQIAKDIEEQLEVEVRAAEFLPIADLRSSVQADVKRVRDSPFIPGEIPVTGIICTTGTGQLEIVDADPLSRIAPRVEGDQSAADPPPSRRSGRST
jgi:carbonic anhydrase